MTKDEDRGDMTVRMPVLSVSYGAFSLTLEGFEDPFATMRDVAEYFRTVLAEDRAFGQGDAAPRSRALRNFAEGRSGRPFDARATGARVHLRATGAPAARAHALPGSALLLDEDAVTAPPAPPLAAEGPGPLPESAMGGRATGIAEDVLTSALEEPRADSLPSSEASEDETRRATRRATLPAGADEAAVERLISQADSALSGAEAKRRQATFAQLKAAVAATRAEADAGGPRRAGARSEAEIARYRNDLFQSVGPGHEKPPARRAAPEGAAAEPIADRAAPSPVIPPREIVDGGGAAASASPLVRAVEQRHGGEVSARQMGPSKLSLDALFDEGASEAPAPAHARAFEGFLAGLEPAGLADRIDAAAAWLCHVEGMEDFPRHQLTRLLVGLEEAQDREAVMVALGVLLREERLRRSRRGQFQTGPRSSYGEAARRFRQES